MKARWFEEIARGTKKIEYREIKPYWTTRLKGQTFDEVHFRNGYAADAPFMRVQWKGMRQSRELRDHARASARVQKVTLIGTRAERRAAHEQ